MAKCDILYLHPPIKGATTLDIEQRSVIQDLAQLISVNKKNNVNLVPCNFEGIFDELYKDAVLLDVILRGLGDGRRVGRSNQST